MPAPLPQRRTFRRQTPDSRREALIRGTLTLIAEDGPAAATVRAIARAAGVSPGLIRHYFATKEDLVNAAYQTHMDRQTRDIAASVEAAGGSARHRLAAMVRVSVTPPVAQPRGLSLWAGFIHLVWRNPEMRATHERTYLHYRDILQRLIEAALAETGRGVPAPEARALAIACNAIVDGLWLEAGALPDAFAAQQTARIALRSVGAVLQLDLETEGEPS